MQKPEQLVWQSLRPLLVAAGAVVQRHEDKYSVGIPDVSVVYGGRSGWIELKAARTSHTPLKLRDAQHNWMASRTNAGCPSFILAHVAGGRWYGGVIGHGYINPRDLWEPTSCSGLVALGGCSSVDPVELVRDLIGVYLPLVGSN